MIRLTDEEIMDVVLDEGLGVIADEDTRAIAKTQLKRVVEWGDEECPHEPWVHDDAKKHTCDKCWQALLEEVK